MENTMRRSASEVIQTLESRIARLEGSSANRSRRTANENANLMIKASFYTGGTRMDERSLTLNKILEVVADKIEHAEETLQADIEMGQIGPGNHYFQVQVSIKKGVVRITSGVTDGNDRYTEGCKFGAWSAFAAAGLDGKDFKTASKLLGAKIESALMNFHTRVHTEA